MTSTTPPSHPSSPARHRFAVGWSLSTLFLIFAGGMVKSTGSSLSVPDWPLSYGMVMPPMVGGIFYEHGHRMIATLVGLMAVIFAIWTARTETRAWVRKAAWAALGLVILQGVLGGLTVIFLLPQPISIAHGCIAQTFFCLTIALAVWTSPRWASEPPVTDDAPAGVALYHGALALAGTCYVQLILGALHRHTGHALELHITGALLVLILSTWVWRRASRMPLTRGIHRTGCALIAVVGTQIALGIASYFIRRHHFDVIPPPLWAPITISLHVATGAVVLGLAVLMALLVYNVRPASTAGIRLRISDYFELGKPGISLTAGITAAAGYVLGAGPDLAYAKLLNVGFGTIMVAGGAGALNMFLEREIDARMARTQSRPLPAGRLSPTQALAAGCFLSVAGVGYLALVVDALPAVIAAATSAIYLSLYTPMKRSSSLCVTVGAVSGALPPVIGWAAATDHVGFPAWVLFGIQFFWQYPHFLSLAWLYHDDYSKGGLRMLPDTGASIDERTARIMVSNSFALWLTSLLPTFLGLTGVAYLATAFLLGGAMTALSFLFFRTPSRSSARRVFFASLAYVPLIALMMFLDRTGALR